VVSLELIRDRVQIQTSDSDKTFYALLDAGLRPEEIEISALGLEQAFVAITQQDNGHDEAAYDKTAFDNTGEAAR
jgi:ABC-2 type transport system ATP-binding protein